MIQLALFQLVFPRLTFSRLTFSIGLFIFLLLGSNGLFAAEETSSPLRSDEVTSESAAPATTTPSTSSQTTQDTDEATDNSTTPHKPPHVFPAELSESLAEDSIFKQTEEIFLFGSHAEQAGILKRLLQHYQTHQQKLDALTKPPDSPTASEAKAAAPNSTAKNVPPVTEPPPAPPNTPSDSEPTPPAKTSSSSDSSAAPPYTFPLPPPLYTRYYEPILKPLFLSQQEPEATLVLLDWITELPLPQEVELIENILKTPQESQATNNPQDIQLKNKALRALTELDITHSNLTALLTTYLTDSEFNLDNPTLIESAVAGLAGKGGAPVRKNLKELFQTATRVDTKITILRSLSQFKAEADIEFFTQILDSREADSVIWTALVELMHYPTHETAESTLLTYVDHKDIRLAARALYALGYFNSETVYQRLLTATKNNDPFVRSEALKALNKQERHLTDIASLVPLLQYKYKYDADSLVKKTAKEILEQHQHPLTKTP